MKQQALDNATTAYTKYEIERKVFDADIGLPPKKSQCK